MFLSLKKNNIKSLRQINTFLKKYTLLLLIIHLLFYSCYSTRPPRKKKCTILMLLVASGLSCLSSNNFPCHNLDFQSTVQNMKYNNVLI